jgi:amino acid transporter
MRTNPEKKFSGEADCDEFLGERAAHIRTCSLHHSIIGLAAERSSVRKTSTPAIFSVVLEVSIFTALLGLGMHALGGLQIDHGDVNAPGHPGVRDYMLRYMAEIFVGGQFGPIFGQVAGWIVTGVFGFLLLSAVNTAIVDLIAISFLMSRDGELPPRFVKLNGFGVPNLGLIVATIIPAILVVAVKDIADLAELYAVGVVGAIATNLGATSTDNKRLPIKRKKLCASNIVFVWQIEPSTSSALSHRLVE